MTDFILQKQIEQRIFNELKADSYVIDTKTIQITKFLVELQLNGDLWFLISKKLDVKDVATLKFESMDNYIETNKATYELNETPDFYSFKDYLNTQTSGNKVGNTFINYYLKFLVVTPIFNKTNETRNNTKP